MAATLSANDLIELERAPSGHFIVAVEIGGQPARFIVDTGASGTIIDTAAAKASGLNQIAGTSLDGTAIGGTVETAVMTLPAIRFGTFTVEHPQVFAMDLSNTLRGMPGVTGIIGQDLLVAADAVIDVAAGTLRVQASKWIKAQTGEYDALPLTILPIGFATLDVTLGGTHVTLIIDSGSPDIMLDHSKIGIFGFGTLASLDSASAVSADGRSIPLYLTPATTLVAGDTMLADGPLTAMDLSHITAMVKAQAGIDIYGVIGNAPLAAKGGLIYLAGQKLFLKKTAGS